jgi:hypothetical protein
MKFFIVQGDHKVSVHLTIIIQKVTSNIQSVPRQSAERGDTRLTLTPSVTPNSNCVIVVSYWNCLKYFCLFFTVIIRCTQTFWSSCICLSWLHHESPLRIIRKISVRVPSWISREHDICVVNVRSHCYRSILVCLYANTITLKSEKLLRAVMDINRETERQVRSDGQTDVRKV